MYVLCAKHMCTMRLQMYYTSTQYTRVKIKPCTMDIKYVLPLYLSLQSENNRYITHRSGDLFSEHPGHICLIICPNIASTKQQCRELTIYFS